MTSDKTTGRRNLVLFFATESRMTRGPDGKVYSTNPNDWYENLSSWLRTFDRLVVIARVVESEVIKGKRVEGPRVNVQGVPNYQGIAQLVLKHRSVSRAVRAGCSNKHAYYGGRFPGILSGLVLRSAKRLKAPVLAHVVGDPRAVLASGVLGLPGRVFAFAGGLILRRQIRQIDAAIYVTEQQLQRSYPVRPGTPAIGLTDVILPPEAFARGPREYMAEQKQWNLVAVGSHDQLYKGHDLLISALAEIRAVGVTATLDLVGAGRFHSRLREHAVNAGVAEHVTFHGHVSTPAEVRTILDSADIFVMPSRTEGTPRALIEAMARGLPCFGSEVGGIPELLPGECLFPVGISSAVSDKLLAAMSDPAGLSVLAQRNIDLAHRIGRLSSPERLDSFLDKFVRVGAKS